MTLLDTFANRPFAPNSIAVKGLAPAPATGAAEFRQHRQDHGDDAMPWDKEASAAAEQYMDERRSATLADLPAGPIDWFEGWYLLNESGYGRATWLGAEVIAALGEWRALWGPYPDLRTDLDRRVLEIGFAARVEREQHSPRAVLPQDMQSVGEVPPAEKQPQTFICGRSVASVLSATAGKLAATPENIHAAAIEQTQHKPLAQALAEIPVTKTNEEIIESIALAESKQFEAQLDELMVDIRDGVVNFEARKNKHNVVELIAVDGRPCWLRRVIQGPMHDIYLERDGLAQGCIVCTQAPTGSWVPTIRRDEIRAWLKLKPGKSAAEASEDSESSRGALRDLVEHTPPVDEIGKFAKSRESAA